MPRANSPNWFAILAGTLLLQILLAVGLGYWTQRQSAVAPQTPLVTADEKTIDRLTIEGPSVAGDDASQVKAATPKIELVRKDSRWILPGSYDAPADAGKVHALFERLSQDKRGSPVGSTKETQRRFRVADESFERHLVAEAGDKPVAQVWLGTATAFRKSAVRAAPDPDVYAVDLATWEMPTTPDEWLDTGLLKVDPSTLSKLDVAEPSASASLEHATGDKPAWKAAQKFKGRELNATHAQALADLIGRMHVDAVLGTKPDPDWNQEHPVLRVALTPAKGEPVTWTVSTPKNGDGYVLKASDKPWYFQLKETTGKPLLDAAALERLFGNDAPPAPPKPAKPAKR